MAVLDHDAALATLGVSVDRRSALGLAFASGHAQDLPWVDVREPPQLEVGTELDERFVVRALIGQGSFGAVYRVLDLTTDEDVALKLLVRPSPRLVARMQREISVLRRLDLPGVVGFLDEGTWQGNPYIVMPLVHGAPFPGPAPDRSWAALGCRLVALAESIARVHAAGVLHRDLKPDNVLWLGDRSVVLDFGLAVDGQLAVESDDLAGTPAYLAPEQYFGEEPDERSDLFSLGAMAYEALSGRRPFGGDTLFAVIQSVLHTVPEPLCDVADVPPSVGAVVDRMLAKVREERPRFAEDVVMALVQALPAGSGVQRERAMDASDLESLFQGPELVHHLKSDPARVLWSRTGGWPRAVERTLESWRRAAICTVSNGVHVLRRADIDRMLAGMRVDPCRGWDAEVPALTAEQTTTWRHVDLLSPWASDGRLAALGERDEGPLRHDLEVLEEAGLVARQGRSWVATRTPPRLPRGASARAHRRAAELVPSTADARIAYLLAGDRMGLVPEACLDVVRARIDEGRVAAAWAIAHEGLMVERRLGAKDDRLIELACIVALEGNAPSWPAMAALEASRRRLTGMAGLLKAGQASLQGEVDGPGLDEVGVLPPELELWRLRLQAYALQRLPIARHQAWLEGHRDRVLALEGGEETWSFWRSRLLHRLGESAEAAEVMEQTLDRTNDVKRWVSVGLNAASIRLEAGDFDAADGLLQLVAERVLSHRVPALEALALHLQRSLAYRRGQPVAHDEELYQALEMLDAPVFVGPMHLTGAAAAWRRGEQGVALAHAQQCAVVWQRSGRLRFWAVARLLLALVDGRGLSAEEAALVAKELKPSLPPGILGQGLALAVRVGVDVDLALWPACRAALLALPYPPAARREILSLDEMTEWIEGVKR